MAETLAKEKAIVEVEEGKAREEAAKCAVIQEEVSKIQKDAEEDLKNAEPLVLQAMAALETLDKKEILSGYAEIFKHSLISKNTLFATFKYLLSHFYMFLHFSNKLFHSFMAQQTGR